MLNFYSQSKELIRCKKDEMESEESETPEGTERLIEFTEFNKSSIKTKVSKLIKKILGIT